MHAEFIDVKSANQTEKRFEQVFVSRSMKYAMEDGVKIQNGLLFLGFLKISI